MSRFFLLFMDDMFEILRAPVVDNGVYDVKKPLLLVILWFL